MLQHFEQSKHPVCYLLIDHDVLLLFPAKFSSSWLRSSLTVSWRLFFSCSKTLTSSWAAFRQDLRTSDSSLVRRSFEFSADKRSKVAKRRLNSSLSDFNCRADCLKPFNSDSVSISLAIWIFPFDIVASEPLSTRVPTARLKVQVNVT